MWDVPFSASKEKAHDRSTVGSGNWIPLASARCASTKLLIEFVSQYHGGLGDVKSVAHDRVAPLNELRRR